MSVKFCVKVFTVSGFAKPLMDLIHDWHGNRNLSKFFSGAWHPTQDMTFSQGHRLRIFMLNFYNVSFTNRHKILKCFRKEKRDFRRAVLSGDMSYLI